MKRIAFGELQERIEKVLLGLGLPAERAALSAKLTAETDRDGVKTHGVARLPRFAAQVRAGVVAPGAVPECVARFGAIERWVGHGVNEKPGPGNLAAYAAMDRAMELAKKNGLGCVALGDTSHWMRAGSYGFQAAEAGFAAMCWSNTLPNLPPWGASTPALGNNPLVIAIPHAEPIVLDIAMSQFSYGSLASYAGRGVALPVPGGYDVDGILTTDAAAIERSQRALPIGFWKGSGLSFVLDVLGAMLSGGKATHQFSSDALQEAGQSQVFLAIAPESLATIEELRSIAEGAIAAVHEAKPIEEGKPARYPGEGARAKQEESMRLGVAIEDAAWEAFETLEQELR